MTRKIITLARECGAELELSDVPTESLVPEPLRNLEDGGDLMTELAKVGSGPVDTDGALEVGPPSSSCWQGRVSRQGACP